jgi:hypothetical protein
VIIEKTAGKCKPEIFRGEKINNSAAAVLQSVKIFFAIRKK